jgi:hypothetical protein
VPYIFKIYPLKAIGLALPLFVPFVRANDTNDAPAPHNFAVLAHFLY